MDGAPVLPEEPHLMASMSPVGALHIMCIALSLLQSIWIRYVSGYRHGIIDPPPPRSCYGFPSIAIGGLPNQGPCRSIFDNVTAFHNHLRQAHAWYCVACHQRNTGMSFPKW